MAGIERSRPKRVTNIGGGDMFYTWQYERIEQETGMFYATIFIGTNPQVSVGSAKMSIDGELMAGDRASSAGTFYEPEFSVGGTPEEWGLSSNKGAALKSDNVGLSFSLKTTDGFGGVARISDILSLDRFDLSAIDNDVDINTIRFDFSGYTIPVGGGVLAFNFVDVTMTVEADFIYRFRIENNINMLATICQHNATVAGAKIEYLASKKDGTFVGSIETVESQPVVKSEINNLHSSMSISFGQNDTTTTEQVHNVITEISENMLTELGHEIIGSVMIPVGVGEGTNIDTNIHIDTIVRYGSYLPFLTEDDQVITTEDAKVIVVANGQPDGKKIFGGYISQWDLGLGNQDSDVTATILSHSQELNNIPLQTEPDPVYQHNPYGSKRLGFGSAAQRMRGEILQSLVISSGSKTIAGIELYDVTAPGDRPDVIGQMSSTLSVYIHQGTIGNNTIVATGSVTLPVMQYGALDKLFIPFSTPVRMVSGQNYLIRLTAQGGSKSTNLYPYPIELAVDGQGRLSGSYGYEHVNGINPYWQDFGWDLKFSLYEQPGEYSRSFFSADPSEILMKLIDFARKNGARVNYDDDSIEMTGTEVTIRFNDVITISDAIAAVFKTMPADWYYYYDPADDKIHAHPRPTSVRRKLVKGRNVVGTPRLTKTIEELVNNVVFVGGEKTDGTTLIVSKQDDESIYKYRRGFKKLTDGRFKDESSAELIIDGEIERGKKPVFSGTATFASPSGEALDIKLGELTQYQGFSNTVDAPEMQIVSITRRIETADISFNLLRPRLSRRVQDLKRNMSNKEAQS